jgi:type IV pilus assembly protein PilZ
MGSKQKQLSLELNGIAALQAACMPFLENGGLFVPTSGHYALGETVRLQLRLLDEAPLSLSAQVVWLTPAAAQGGRQQGIGVHFSAAHSALRSRIEQYLTGMPEDGRPSHTL